MEEKNILDILLDPECDEPITLFNEDGGEIVFEQIALIHYKENLYCILLPVDPDAVGIGEDEAMVFLVVTDAEEPYVEVETDDDVIDGVFALYEQLVAESEEEE